MQFRREYPVPIDLRRDEHAFTMSTLIGDVDVSMRQLLYLAIAGAVLLAVGLPLPKPARWVVLPFLGAILVPIALLLGWAPAGVLGLPGPKNRDRSGTVQELPLRLDEWLAIWLSWRLAPKVVPYAFRPSRKKDSAGAS